MVIFQLLSLAKTAADHTSDVWCLKLVVNHKSSSNRPFAIKTFFQSQYEAINSSLYVSTIGYTIQTPSTFCLTSFERV